MNIVKEYILPFIFIVVAAGVLGFIGFMLLVAFIVFLFQIMVKVGFGVMLIAAALGFILLLFLVATLIRKVYRKDF